MLGECYLNFMALIILVLFYLLADVFAFDLYDTDADGALTEIEVKVLFHDLYWYGIEHKEDEKSRRYACYSLSMPWVYFLCFSTKLILH